jgi:hypothetical protein
VDETEVSDARVQGIAGSSPDNALPPVIVERISSDGTYLKESSGVDSGVTRPMGNKAKTTGLVEAAHAYPPLDSFSGNDSAPMSPPRNSDGRFEPLPLRSSSEKPTYVGSKLSPESNIVSHHPSSDLNGQHTKQKPFRFGECAPPNPQTAN